MSEYNDEEMTWDAWLWVAGIAVFGGLLAIALFGLLIIVLGATA